MGRLLYSVLIPLVIASILARTHGLNRPAAGRHDAGTSIVV